MLYCCEKCFSNEAIKKFIQKNSESTGECQYCGSCDTPLISVQTLGEYMCSCLEKAYEHVDEGTGAMYDGEDKIYIGPAGNEATVYSVREILMEEETFSDITDSYRLADDLFSELLTYEEQKDGVYNPFCDIDSVCFVIKEDLFGLESTQIFYNWELFKHTIRHYNRFFEVDGGDIRSACLEMINLYLYDFITDIDIDTVFYRAREQDTSIKDITGIDSYKEMGPAPYNKAKTNRMSPAGISYLYVAGDKNTAFSECRLDGKRAIVAEFKSKESLQIIDFSRSSFYWAGSIFEDDYDHDDRWISDFLKNFVEEITSPVDDNVEDHSYDYAATQVIAEYLRSKNYDGICFNSSVGEGKSYVFFYGPDTEHAPNAYPYPFGDPYLSDMLPVLRPFTECFDITYIEVIDVLNDGKVSKVIETRKL
ncbi:MAG: RES domain-containing protein [Lachnospiraceae bacterium]|nr:RES domain-containing protein [Lachnospiraceae bacterium]